MDIAEENAAFMFNIDVNTSYLSTLLAVSQNKSETVAGQLEITYLLTLLRFCIGKPTSHSNYYFRTNE